MADGNATPVDAGVAQLQAAQQEALNNQIAMQTSSLEFSSQQNMLQSSFENQMAAIEAERNAQHAAAQSMKRGAAQMGQA